MKKINIKTISNINLGILTFLYLGILEYIINVDIRAKTIIFILFLIIIQKLRYKKSINFQKIPKLNNRLNYLFVKFQELLEVHQAYSSSINYHVGTFF